MAEKKERWRSIKKKFDPVCPVERTPKKRMQDERKLLDRIEEARAKRELSSRAASAFQQLLLQGDWITGVVNWSNDQWCEMLGMPKGSRKRERPCGASFLDKSPYRLRAVFAELRRLGLAERIELRAHDRGALQYKSELWEHGIWVTRRLVWDVASFEAALSAGIRQAPAQKRAGAPPPQNDRGRPRPEESGGAPGLNRAGHPLTAFVSLSDTVLTPPSPEPFFSFSDAPAPVEGSTPVDLEADRQGRGTSPRSGQTPLATRADAAVPATSGAQDSRDSRHGSDKPRRPEPPSGTRISAAPRLESTEGGRANAGPYPDLESAARAWLAFRRKVMYRDEEPAKPSKNELQHVLAALETYELGQLQLVVVVSHKRHKDDDDRDRRWTVRALLKPDVIDWALDRARNRAETVAQALEAPSRRHRGPAPSVPDSDAAEAGPIATDWAPELADSIMCAVKATAPRTAKGATR